MAGKEDKKRKRQSNDLDTPNKKAAVESANAGSIKVHVNSDSRSYPVVASSPGLSAPSIPFKAYAKPLSNKSSNASPKPSTHNLLLQSSQHPRLDYTASPIGLEQNLSHYIAIFDPSTNQLQITPAHHLSLRSTLRTENKQDEPDKTRRTMLQQREELGREFGTKKAKKAIADKTVNAIVRDANGNGKSDAAQDAVLESMEDAAAAALNEKEQLKATLASKPMPTPNIEAENVEDIYTFNSLISPADARLITIKEWQDKVQAEENIDFNHRIPAFRIKTLVQSGNTHRLKALRYLTHLLEFHDALQSAGQAKKKVPKKDAFHRKLSSWPEALIDSTRRRFANVHNELIKWNLENLYVHMCALTLYVDGWTTEIGHLRDDLKMENREIVQYFRELGCKVAGLTERERETRGLKKTEAAATRMAKLRLPLDFPKAKSGRRR